MIEQLEDELTNLTRLAVEVQRRRSVPELLQLVVDRTAELLGVDHVSLRLLDPTRTRLVAACRTGDPGEQPPIEFELGEGLGGWVAQHAAPLCSNDPQHDPRYVSRSGLTPIYAFLGVPLMAGTRCVGVLAAVEDRLGRRRFVELDRCRLELIAAICAPHLEIARLSRLTRVDPLTGALNRRGLARVYGPNDVVANDAMCVALADIDRFKLVNDEHGHAIGDEVLKHVARCIASVLRADDAFVRYGGEEFVVLLPGVQLATALKVAERARAAVEGARIKLDDVTIGCTVSIGVAERRGGETRRDLLARADAAMYEAKAAGRNRVVAAR